MKHSSVKCLPHTTDFEGLNSFLYNAVINLFLISGTLAVEGKMRGKRKQGRARHSWFDDVKLWTGSVMIAHQEARRRQRPN